MQEIIASIGRIIAEDSRASNPAPGAPGDKSSVLELTEAIAADGSVRKLAGAEPLSRQFPAQPPAPTAAAPSDAPPVAKTASRVSVGSDAGGDLVSAATAGAAVAAFGRLGAIAGEQRAAPGVALGGGGRTLEEIVRDVLRPLLQAWLEEHLSEIVERLVQDEIQRLVREARLR